MLKKILGKSIAPKVRDLAFAEPVYWQKRSNHAEDHIDSDFCVIKTDTGKNYFVHGIIDIPIKGSKEVFGWGVWVTLSEKNFQRYKDVFGKPQERQEEPYFGWLANEIPGYDDCLTVKTHVHLQGTGHRPLIVLDPGQDHPLAHDQQQGITLEQAQAHISK